MNEITTGLLSYLSKCTPKIPTFLPQWYIINSPGKSCSSQLPHSYFYQQFGSAIKILLLVPYGISNSSQEIYLFPNLSLSLLPCFLSQISIHAYLRPSLSPMVQNYLFLLVIFYVYFLPSHLNCKLLHSMANIPNIFAYTINFQQILSTYFLKPFLQMPICVKRSALLQNIINLIILGNLVTKLKLTLRFTLHSHLHTELNM